MSIDPNLPKLSGFVFWLIPSEPYASFYQKEIDRLSVRFEKTRFTPHLTLGRLTDDNLKQQKFKFSDSLFPSVNKKLSAIHVHTECRMTPYQNLIHILNPSHKIDQLQSELQTFISEYQPKKEDYHVSLMYGDVPCSALNQEIADLSRKIPKKVNFSKISVIELNGQPDTWHTLWEHEF